MVSAVQSNVDANCVTVNNKLNSSIDCESDMIESVVSQEEDLTDHSENLEISTEESPITLSISKTNAKSMKSQGIQVSRNKRTSLSHGTASLMKEEHAQEVAKRFIELQVSNVYRSIRKQTGALGGNAAGGAIYGEITQNSFQRVVDFMKMNCEFNASSLFLDVGSGLGKPNFHVAIDPGVEVSYGIELEELRYHLSLHNLKSVLLMQQQSKLHPDRLRNRTVFSVGDITDAKTFEPFTHIYSFDVGFPPNVMEEIAKIFNKSTANYYTSFHTPKKIKEVYGFKVDSIGYVTTSMAGSSEGHRCYFYKRIEAKRRKKRPEAIHSRTNSENVIENSPSAYTDEQHNTTLSSNIECTKQVIDLHNDAIQSKYTHQSVHLPIDKLFQGGFHLLSKGTEEIISWVQLFFGEQTARGRTRRQKRSHSNAFGDSNCKLSQQPLKAFYRVVGKRYDIVENNNKKLQSQA